MLLYFFSMYAFVFWCEDVIFVISPRESQRPPTTSLTVVLSPSSKISCWQHCHFPWSELLEKLPKKVTFQNLGQNYISYIASSSWGGIGSLPWKSACPVVVLSDLLLAEIGTAAVMPKTGFPVRETITEKNVVGVTYDFLDANAHKSFNGKALISVCSMGNKNRHVKNCTRLCTPPHTLEWRRCGLIFKRRNS